MNKLDDEFPDDPRESGPIDPSKKPIDVRQTPYPLPKQFVWSPLDLTAEETTKEVYSREFG